MKVSYHAVQRFRSRTGCKKKTRHIKKRLQEIFAQSTEEKPGVYVYNGLTLIVRDNTIVTFFYGLGKKKYT